MNKTATEVVFELVSRGMGKEAASAKDLIKFINNKKFRGLFGKAPRMIEHNWFDDPLENLVKANDKLKLYRRSIGDPRIKGIQEIIKNNQKMRNSLFHEVLNSPEIDAAIKRYQ